MRRRDWMLLTADAVAIGALVVAVIVAWDEASVAVRAWGILFMLVTVGVNAVAFNAIIHYRTLPSRAGVVRTFKGRQDLQASGYAVSDILRSLPPGSRVLVLARSARAWLNQSSLLRTAIDAGQLAELSFFLPEGDISAYDQWGAADLSLVKTELQTRLKSPLINVHLLPFCPTYSIVLTKSGSEHQAIVDLFADLPLEDRHSVLLRSSNGTDAYLIDACVKLFELYSKYPRA